MQAQAHWALGVLHYQGGASDMARTALLLALRLDPGLTWNRQFSALLARTLVGKEQVAQMKRLVGRA
jgi:hypothetical protein